MPILGTDKRLADRRLPKVTLRNGAARSSKRRRCPASHRIIRKATETPAKPHGSARYSADETPFLQHEKWVLCMTKHILSKLRSRTSSAAPPLHILSVPPLFRLTGICFAVLVFFSDGLQYYAATCTEFQQPFVMPARKWPLNQPTSNSICCFSERISPSTTGFDAHSLLRLRG